MLRLAEDRRPGFIGDVPYLLVLRVLVALSVVARVLLPGAHWQSGGWVVGVAVLMALAGLLHYHAVGKQRGGRVAEVRNTMMVVVVLDLLAVSGLYYATGTPTSDLYLFYYLPLLETAEHLRLHWTLIALAGSWLGSAFALWAMTGGKAMDSLVLFAMRGSILSCFVVVSLLLTRIQDFQNRELRAREAEGKQRQHQMAALLDLSRELATEFDERSILDRATRFLKTRAADLGDLQVGILDPEHTLALASGLQAQELESLRELILRIGARDLDYAATGSGRLVVLVPLRVYRVLFGNLWVAGSNASWGGNSAAAFWRLAGQILATALARARRIEAYREISALGADLARQDFEVERILRSLVVDSRFEFAGVSALDKYTNRVRMVRTRNIPPGWVSRSDYAASTDKDILVDIVKTGKTETIEGWDERFNRDIFEKFGHEQLIRMYTPITVDGDHVGVLEVGARQDRRDLLSAKLQVPGKRQFQDERNREVVESAELLSGLMRGISDATFLEQIADKALSILGIGAAIIHIFETASDGTIRVVLNAGRGTGITPDQVWELGLACAQRPPTEAEQIIGKSVGSFCKIVPLELGARRRGQLVLLCWQEDPGWTSSDQAVAEVYARLVERLIWTSDTIKETRTRGKLGWTASSLQCVLQSLVADPNDSRTVPQRLAYHLLAMLDADVITLYERRADGRLLTPVYEGKLESEPVGGWSGWSKLVADTLKGGTALFLPKEQLEERGWRGAGRFATREGVQSCAALILRAHSGDEPIGVLFASYRDPKTFDEETRSMMENLAQTVAIALRTTQINERLQDAAGQWQQEVAALVEVEQLVLQHRDVDDPNAILKKILGSAVDITQAHHGVFLRWDPASKTLIPHQDLTHGFKGMKPPVHPLGEGLVGVAARDRRAILLSDANDASNADQKFYKNTIPDTRSQLAVPLVDQDEIRGVLSLEHSDPNHFQEQHVKLVDMLGRQAVLAMRVIQLVEEVEQQGARLSALSDIAARIRNRDLSGKIALRQVLTGITAGTGMGFNRAAIYALEDGFVFGKAAKGPLDKDEWDRIWPRLPKSTPLAQLLDEEERQTQASSLEQWVVAQQSPSEELDGIPKLPGGVDRNRAWVPISPRDAEDRVLGYIAADRQFSAPGSEVSEADRLLLKQFAHLTADILRRENPELLPAGDLKWIEYLRQVFHDARPYFARAQEALAQGADGARALRHTTRGLEELARMRELPWRQRPRAQFNLIRIIEEACELFGHCIDRNSSHPELLLNGSPRCIETVFLELFQNALDERPSGDLRLNLRVFLVADLPHPSAIIEVEDNAGGRAEELQGKLFEQNGYSTKGPSRGFGGTRISRIMKEHFGTAEVDQGTEGIIVRLCLPLAAPAQPQQRARGAGG